jgi:3-deoxy-manno-octulosonate cytidylyltransferase (CMP-KDO synthetase)
MAYTVVIPARYASTRLPGKALLEIAGKPMIQHVYERACQSEAGKVVIATDSELVQKAAQQFNAPVCMTAESHQSGTDRLQEAVSQLGLQPDEVVVNVQGDEPLIPPAVINQVASNLVRNKQASIATLCEPIDDVATAIDPNAVKVVMDNEGYALYFSRAAIPWPRDEFAANQNVMPGSRPFNRHIGIYAYRTQFLHDFVSWPVAHLEAIECLEQLRAMANGRRIHVAQACEAILPGVDTEEDLERVRASLSGR